VTPTPHANLEQGERLRQFFLEAGYTEENMKGGLQMDALPSKLLGNLPRLLDQTSEPSRIHTLLRLFFIGVGVEPGSAEDTLGADGLELLRETSLVVEQNSKLLGTALLAPFEDIVVAADHFSTIVSFQDPQAVLWPNPTTRQLDRFRIRRHWGSVLDLGTGSGTLALRMAAQADRLTGTDLNPRAIEFARFNASVYGCGEIEWFTGDSFQPVEGRTFDLIISNPPFFVTPSADLLYCQNPGELDGFCRQVIQTAPNYLNEGGFLQIMFEWVEIEGQPWQERLQSWLQGLECDVWILKGYSDEVSRYTQSRLREMMESCDEADFSRWIEYYRSRRVRHIHGGVLALRKRSGRNWVWIEEKRLPANEPFGEAVLNEFLVRDFLRSDGDEARLEESRLRLSPAVKLMQEWGPGPEGWQQGPMKLQVMGGLPCQYPVDPAVVKFLNGLTGARPLREVVDELLPKVQASPEQVRRECMEVTRRLLERGFLLLEA